MQEESFPRGGVDKPAGRSKKKQTRDDTTDLFAEAEPVEREGGKKRKKERKRDVRDEKKPKKHKMEGGVSGRVSELQPDLLHNKTMYPGMLVLTCVKSVGKYKLVLSLPNELSGVVTITRVSHAYTSRLQHFTKAHADGWIAEEENVSTLSELFQEGMLLTARVMDIEPGKEGKPPTVNLSIDPQDVNVAVKPGHLRNNMCIPGSIVSQEDHGYTVDIGVKGVQAFLNTKEAQNYIKRCNEGHSLHVGQSVMCKLVMKEDSEAAGPTRVVPVTIDPGKVQVASKEVTEVPFTSLVAGVRVRAKVLQSNKAGLVVTFLKFKGTVHASHLPDSMANYTTGKQVTCVILYIHPLSKAISLSLLPHLVTYTAPPVCQFTDFHVGEIVQDATVKKVERSRGVHFLMKGDTRGLAQIGNLDTSSRGDPQSTFTKGSKHRCRVVGLNYIENYVVVTTKQDILDRKYMAVSDIHPGELIEVTVQKLMEKGVSVKVSKNITGFIPKLHLADINLRHPEKKFKAAAKLTCRVLYVDVGKSNVILTHKKSLVRSQCPVITEYSQIECGQLLEGCIVKIRDKGVIVKFYNDVRGFVPRSLLSKELIQYIDQAYFVGQVVQCRVVRVNPEEQQLILSFMLEDDVNLGPKEMTLPADCNIGKCVQCSVTKKKETGLEVLLLPSKVKAFIPRVHLSDSMEMSGVLWDLYEPEDIIEEVMIYSKQQNVVIVTKKLSMISAAKQEKLVMDVEAVQAGMTMVGAVHSVCKFGVFVQFPGGLRALVRTANATDKSLSHLGDLYETGQTVVVMVIKNDLEKQQIEASMRDVDGCHGDEQQGMNGLQSYLTDRAIVQRLGTRLYNDWTELGNVRVGSVHMATVISKHDIGLVCELESGIKAVVSFHHLGGCTAAVGDSVPCVILYVDLVQHCVEASVAHKLVSHCQKRAEKNSQKLQQAHADQSIKCDVMLVKEDFILLALRGHATGQLAYAPTRKYLITSADDYSVGQVGTANIHRVEGDLVLASVSFKEGKKKSHRETRRETLADKKVGVEELLKRKRTTSETSDSGQNVKKPRSDSVTGGDDGYVSDSVEDSEAASRTSRKNSKSKKTQGAKTVHTSRASGGESESVHKKDKKRMVLEHGSTGSMGTSLDSSDSETEDHGRLELSEGFSWDTNFKLPSAVTGEIISDDSDDDTEQKPVKKTKEEIRKEKQEEERRIFEYERQQLEGERQPETADDYDRLVLQSPNSSLVWLRYMAFHLETSEIDKARAVAERALKTISFREEQEKLNVWVALLNLENMYGSNETIDKVLTRAVQMCDKISIYTQMIDIYTQSGKIESAEQLFQRLLKRHPGNVELWLKCGQFYFGQGRLQSARQLLQRALKALETTHHVGTIVKFAQMEFKQGEPERGKTMFENILSTYPGRTDLWSVYIDMVTKLKDHAVIRTLYKRVTNLKMSAKKMKFLFKKYLNFEEKNGTPDQIAEVKRKALEYVESQGYVDE